MSDNFKCPAGDNWTLYRADLAENLKELRKDMRTLVQNSECLPRMGVAIDLLADKIETSNQKILEAAIGKEHIPIETVKSMFSQVSKSHATLYRVFGAIILSLLTVIVFLLIGEKAEWIRELVRQY